MADVCTQDRQCLQMQARLKEAESSTVNSATRFKQIAKQHAEILDRISWYASHAYEWSIRDEDDFDEFSDEILDILLEVSDG